MARMMLHSEAFRFMTKAVMDMAALLCAGRLLMTHEGGYHLTSVPFHALAVLEQLSGIRSGISDPFLPLIEGFTHQGLQPHQEAVIQQAEQLLTHL